MLDGESLAGGEDYSAARTALTAQSPHMSNFCVFGAMKIDIAFFISRLRK